MVDHFVVSLAEAQTVLQEFSRNKANIALLNSACDCLADTVKCNRRIYSCGNGGSICDSMHFAEELTGRFKKDREPIAAVSISDPAHISCVANDFGYEFIFSRYVEAWGNKGDLLLAISTSGNSPNIINATLAAKKKDMKVVGLLGKGGGKLKEMVDFPIIVESNSTARIQEIHIKVIHMLIEGIERKLFPDHY